LADVPILKHFAIHSAQAIFLREMARREGKISFTWDYAREDVRGMVADLIQKEIVKYVELVSSPNQQSGPTYLILTDAGRRVVGQLEAADRRKTTVASEAPATPVEVDGGPEGSST
jgi:hypothetical protein